MSFTSLPPGTSSLTATPRDDFESNPAWVQLAELGVKTSSSAFWHCIDTWTYSQHFNKTIWRIDLLSESSLPSPSTSSAPAETHSKRPRGSAPPSPNTRWIALRELQRKTPSPVGGGPDGRSLSFSAHEWTAQYVDGATNRHVAIFGLVIPDAARENGNLRALTMWPFQYAKTRAMAVSYDPCDDGGGVMRYCVLPLEIEGEVREGRDFETIKKYAQKSGTRMLTTMRKRFDNFDDETGLSTYVKRVEHDNLVPEALYRKHVCRMKQTYGLLWAKRWPEFFDKSMDPQKYVYEELSIAAYLIALFEVEEAETGRKEKASFVDLGCGNGFLTYLLISEGYSGRGIDLQKRSIWDAYPDEVSVNLFKEKIDPETYTCSDVDWIIGNHSDELTPWLPAITARSQAPRAQGVTRTQPRLYVLPCCFFDFDERKYAAGFKKRAHYVKDQGQGRYELYLLYIERLLAAYGFEVVRENMRIPSTKYVAIIGRDVAFPERMAPTAIEETTKIALEDAIRSHVKTQ